MASYDVLKRLPAEAYLDPDNFRTPTDGWPKAGYAEAQYAKALEMGRAGGTLHISVGSTWSFAHANGAHTTAYEGIGYHSCTHDLLRGFLDSGCGITVHRFDPDAPEGQRYTTHVLRAEPPRPA